MHILKYNKVPKKIHNFNCGKTIYSTDKTAVIFKFNKASEKLLETIDRSNLIFAEKLDILYQVFSLICIIVLFLTSAFLNT